MTEGSLTPRLTPAYYGDTPNIDGFSRLRVSSQATLFESQSGYNLGPLRWESGQSGTGVAPTYSTSTRMTALSATAGTGTSWVQSFGYIPYEPGKSQLAFMTFVMGAAVAGAVTDVGLFDANNGIIFRQNGTTNLQFILRTSTSGSVSDANIVAQSSWNIDPLNGTGQSGITLDVTKSQIMVIDAQFLGMGRVRIGFDIGGQVVYAHQFLNANATLSVPYMQQLTLPIGMLITATATGSTKTCYFKCASVSSEGGQSEPFGYDFATPSVSVTAASGTATALLSVRPKTTYNSITNRMHFSLRSVDILNTGNYPVLWQVCIGSTFSAAPTYADVNTSYSGFEYSSSAGTLSAVGAVIDAGYTDSGKGSSTQSISRNLAQKYSISLDRAGSVRANGTLTLVVTGIGGASTGVYGMMNFSEVH